MRGSHEARPAPDLALLSDPVILFTLRELSCNNVSRCDMRLNRSLCLAYLANVFGRVPFREFATIRKLIVRDFDHPECHNFIRLYNFMVKFCFLLCKFFKQFEQISLSKYISIIFCVTSDKNSKNFIL